jgi:hypothetical protein
MASDTTKINLHHDIRVNGVFYRAGTNVEVPSAQADDIARMDYEHQQYKENLHRKNVYEVDSGTIAMGGN